MTTIKLDYVDDMPDDLDFQPGESLRACGVKYTVIPYGIKIKDGNSQHWSKGVELVPDDWFVLYVVFTTVGIEVTLAFKERVK